jgi:hypothetical protein
MFIRLLCDKQTEKREANVAEKEILQALEDAVERGWNLIF